MKIIVCIKQVPDTETRIKLVSGANKISTDDIKFIVNPYDEYAVEEALKIKEKLGGEVTVITVPGDTFDKAIGLDKALQRAKIAQSLDAEARFSFYKKVPYTLSNLFEEMTERAEIYYANK